MTDQHPARAIHAVVTGVVQGVGFRYSTQRRAVRLGLTGWVRNRRDGSVEVWAQGDTAPVDELAAFLGEGPPGARVTSVRITEEPADPACTRFSVTF